MSTNMFLMADIYISIYLCIVEYSKNYWLQYLQFLWPHCTRFFFF